MMTLRNTLRTGIALIVVTLAPVMESGAQIRAMIEVGLNGSTLRGNSSTDFSPITRLGGGAGVIMDLNRHFQFQSEILYLVKGSSAEGYPFQNDVLVEATFDLTYLEIPLLLVYRVGTSSLRPRVFVGPTIAIKLDSQISYRAASGGPTQTQEDETVENRDMGLMFGAAVETDIGGETIMAGLRSSLGFTNARKDNPSRPDNPPLYNTTIGLFVAIVF